MRLTRVMTVPVGILSSLLLMGSGVTTGSESSGGGSDTAPSAPPEALLSAKAEALPGFSYDTGLIPAASPIQVQLALSAAGGLKADAVATQKDGAVVPRPASGKLTLDVHMKMAGKLKVESMLTKYDGAIPGLTSIDIPIGGEVGFEPFLLGQGEGADVTVSLPETRLPSVPLGAIPGSLVLTVSSGSTLTTRYQGKCVSATGGKVRYMGLATTTGKLLLKGQIVPSLPKPLNKPIDLKQFEVAVPATVIKLDGTEVMLPGAIDQKLGTCP